MAKVRWGHHSVIFTHSTNGVVDETLPPTFMPSNSSFDKLSSLWHLRQPESGVVPTKARADPSASPGVKGSYSFVRETERTFWLDSDGVNRWIPALTAGGEPAIEDRKGDEETCTACGTPIRWLCFVVHPTRGSEAVGRCCIRKVIGALPDRTQEVYRDAVSSLDRAARNATREAQGKPPIVGRKERLRNHITALEAVIADPTITGAAWFYNGNRHSLRRDVVWYLGELKAGRRRSSFQSALRAALEANGHPDVFA